MEQNKGRLSTLSPGCPSLSFKMLQRAATFLEDLLSNNAYKLLSGNLSFAVSHHQSEGREEEKESSSLPPICQEAASAWMTLAYFQQGKRSTHTGTTAGGRNERTGVKRNAEPAL